MKNYIFTLLIFLSIKGWGQSPAFNLSTSSMIAQPLFETKIEDGFSWKEQPASFAAGMDYMVPFGKNDFISVGVQYRQWQYKYPLETAYLWCGTGLPGDYPKFGAEYLITNYKEFAIPINYWIYSSKRKLQTFARVGFTPTYVSNASIRTKQFRRNTFSFLDRDKFNSWNYSADLSLGLQWNFSKRVHTYLAANSQLYLRKNQLHMFNQLGVGLEFGVRYNLKN